jgi:GDPmannose 4,6-dehydratase
VVEVDPRYYRPRELDVLLRDVSKAREELGWQLTTSLETIVREMVESDLADAKEQAVVVREAN